MPDIAPISSVMLTALLIVRHGNPFSLLQSRSEAHEVLTRARYRKGNHQPRIVYCVSAYTSPVALGLDSLKKQALECDTMFHSRSGTYSVL